MNRNIWIGIVAVAIVLAGGYFALYKSQSASGTVTLGVIAGTTGDYAAAGEAYINGFELAREEWNTNHSLQFTDVTEDDGFNAQKGVSAYTKLKSLDKVDAYAVVSSFTIDAIVSDLQKEGKPVALGFEQSIPAQDDNIFQVLPAARPVQQGLGTHLKELGYKKPVVLVSNNTSVYTNFALGFIDGYGSGATKMEVTGKDSSTIRSLATKVLSENPDIVVFYTDPPAGALLARELITQAKGKTPQLVFDQSIESGKPDYVKVFGDTLIALDGAIIALSKNDLTDNFKTLYKQKYNTEPPFATDMGYNSFTLLATTYNADSKQWVANMRQEHFTGADGDVSFDSVGLRVPNTTFGKLSEGQIKLGQ